jgi:hydroxymethylglutaryl-CoA reductase
MKSSRIPGFYKLALDERIDKLAETYELDRSEIDILRSQGALELEQADKMIENAVGIYSLPIGVGLNFLINGKDYLVPMAIEEPSVVASCSFMAKLVRDAGGFTAGSTERVMIGQVQVVGCEDFRAAKNALYAHREELIALANALVPNMVKRGGGALDLDVRLLNDNPGATYSRMLVLHLYINTQDAMGANTINTMVEGIAPRVEELTGGKVYLRILSNYTDTCLAWAKCVVPPHVLATDGWSGEQVIEGMIQAHAFAASDTYRAVTHNKGVMNGIDAVVIATGNDWRAIEAGAHAYAARSGQYGPMTDWSRDENGNLVGFIELPMPVGTVGGSIGMHPMAQVALKFVRAKSARELAEVILAVGLAQNMAAIRALATTGIQKGHMALHARTVAVTAGARGELVERIAQAMVEAQDIKLSKAMELLAAIAPQ